MAIFRNSRDQMQIRILARQIFPTDWNEFLKYYEDETNKEYGHVILDFHPQTRNEDRIVKFYQTEKNISKGEYAAKQQIITESQQKHESESEQQKCQGSILNDFDILMKKEDDRFSEVKGLLWNQQQVLNVMKQSLLDIKQNALRNKMEEDFLARGFQNKQQQDLELIKQFLLDFKQRTLMSGNEPDVLDKDSLALEKVHGTKSTNDQSGKRKKRKVRHNEPND